MQEQYMKQSLAELRELAKERGLKGVSSLRKNELAQLLAQTEAVSAPVAPNRRQADGQPVSGQQTGGRQTGGRQAAGQPVPAAQADAPETQAASASPAGQGAGTAGASRNTTVRVNRRNTSLSGGQSRGGRHFEPSSGSRSHHGAGSHLNRNANGSRGEGNSRNEGNGRGGEGGFRSESVSRNENSVRGENSVRSENGYRNDNGVRGEEYIRGEGSPRGDMASSVAEETVSRPAAVDDLSVLDSGESANGILEVMSDGFGFIRCENYLPGENDVYVSPSQIRRFNMKTGDIVNGAIRIKTGQEKFAALLYVKSINGEPPSVAEKRRNFEDLTPIFPNSRIRLETAGGKLPMRIVDLLCPIGKGQRGMIVSPPKAGKTTLLKQVAKAVTLNHPDMHLLILLIDERPEEVTDMKESIQGENVEVIYSTFDELPEHHKRVSEMVLGRAKRLVEHGKDVIILLDSITRLARAYNLTVTASGRTLSGGLDPAALYMPKKFFGAARNMREGGSLTVLATALVDTGSRMDDVVFEEFKGTGNMELVLDRKLSEKRIFPAIDLLKSGTRRDDLLLSREEYEAVYVLRKALNGMKAEEAAEHILDMFARTRNNREFVQAAQKIRL